MAPVSLWSHAVVSLEALIGLLAVALGTGLSFARFSRPLARVLFSEYALLSRRDGVECLVFRVANLRSTELLDARLRVAVLLDEVTREGEQLRRLHDLTLERDSLPSLAVTWLVVHRLDERSPLYGCDLARLRDSDVRIFVTLTGLDTSLSQTVFARFFYDPVHILADVRFADVVTRRPDGSVHLALERFHDVISQNDPEPR